MVQTTWCTQWENFREISYGESERLQRNIQELIIDTRFLVYIDHPVIVDQSAVQWHSHKFGGLFNWTTFFWKKKCIGLELSI